jgi:hypothetical protein
MRKILTLVFALSFVPYLSGTALAQGRVGGHGPAATERIDHDRDVDHNKTHGKADAPEHGKEPFIDRIQGNPQLTAKLTALLPMSGPNSTLVGAAMGFKNRGQFIAALHVAQNLASSGITFDLLKAKMIGPPAMKLGQAIQALDPKLSAKEADTAEDLAEKQAKADIHTTRTPKPTT